MAKVLLLYVSVLTRLFTAYTTIASYTYHFSFPTGESHMQSPPRVFNPIYPIAKTGHNTLQRPNRTRSFLPHLSVTKPHSTLSKKHIHLPLHRPHLSPSSSITSPCPLYSNVFPRAVSSSSASHTDPGPWHRVMPSNRREKGASREVQISRSLSYLLRHGAKDEGIQVDEAGWANVADVVGFL